MFFYRYLSWLAIQPKPWTNEPIRLNDGGYWVPADFTRLIMDRVVARKLFKLKRKILKNKF